MKFFEEKNILITGAAHGVGKSLALMLKDSASRLVLLDKDYEVLNKLIDEGNFSCPVSVFKVDLADINSLEKIIQEILIEISFIDIFINNAGVSVISPIDEQKKEDINWITNINLVSAMEISRLVIPGMKKRRSGNLAFIGSAAGIQGFPNKATYCATKFGIYGFADALQTELSPFGISVTLVFPGPVSTNMLSRSRVSDMKIKEQTQHYLTTKGDSPWKVASLILNGIRKKKQVVLVSAQSKILWFFKRLMPVTFTKLITKFQNKLPV